FLLREHARRLDVVRGLGGLSGLDGPVELAEDAGDERLAAREDAVRVAVEDGDARPIGDLSRGYGLERRVVAVRFREPVETLGLLVFQQGLRPEVVLAA